MKELKKSELKYYVCLFKMEGHETFRMQTGKTVNDIEYYLKTQIGKNKVTARKFFEIDRLTGKIEEF